MATNKEKLIAGAQKLVEKGQFDKAIKEYLKVVATDDKDVRIWLKIGDLYAKLGKKQEASETYQKVAEFYSEQGFYLKSVAVYKQILKIDPRLVDVNQRLAELYKQLGLLSDAMQQYETVASFWHKEGKTKEALAALKQIVELDPETVANRIKLAELYSKEQMPREAIDEFTKAAEQLKEQGRTDDYMKVAERLLFHSPDNRPVSKELARMYIEKGDPRRALPKLQVCFKADPRDTEVLTLLSKAFEALDQRSKAVSVLKELARILGENGDRQARDEVYRRILTLSPNDPDAETALGGAPRKAASAPAPAPIPQRAAPLGASWPPPPTMEEPPPDEFDDVKVPGDPGKNKIQPPTTVGKLLDPSEPIPNPANDGEEIARILNETDVYIKYKLYAKAIEHVQRVFEHDPRHVEAREKLKALYLTVGKREEAVLELWALSEQAEAGRQRRYLREILELDPTNAKASSLLGEEPASHEVVVKPKRGGGSSDELLDVEDLEELPDEEFDVADPSGKIDLNIGTDEDDAGTLNERRAMPSLTPRPGLDDDSDEVSVESEEPEPESAEDEDDDDLIPLVVDPMADKAADSEESEVEDRFGFDDDGSGEVEDCFGFGSEEPEDGSLEVAGQRFGVSDDDSAANPVSSLSASDSEEQGIVAGIEKVSVRPSPKVSAKRAPSFGDNEASDADVRTRFDDQAAKLLASEMMLGAAAEEVDESDLPPVENIKHGTKTVPSAPLQRGLAPETVPQPKLSSDALRTDPGRGTAPLAVEPKVERAAVEAKSETSMEDDLDEADFFVQQSLFDEARAILETLLERHPSHPLVNAKLRDLEAMERAAGVSHTDAGGVVPQVEIAADMSAELPDDLPGATEAGAPSEGTDAPSGEQVYELTRRGVIEKGVTAEDFETHYDLGIAYKEMGLLDDAISEFKQVMKDPAREVQCHLMIGLCCLEKGMQTEAIGHFKKGLYVEGITERESLSLYFELGQAYERLGDPREALYYYEKVLKRDPRFRNVERLVEALRAGSKAAALPAPAGPSDDVDAAFDTLLGSGES